MSEEVPHVQEAEKLMLDAFTASVTLNIRLYEQREGKKPDDRAWKQQNFPFGEVYLSGNQSQGVVSALEEYELQGPGRLKAASEIFEKVHKKLKAEHESGSKNKRKIGKGATAARTLSRVTGMAAEALATRDGIVTRYGVPYAVVGYGTKAWKGDYDLAVRCVPIDISSRARRSLWKGIKSVTLVSATLSDDAPGDFRYTLSSLGLDDAEGLRTLCVNSPFNYGRQQLVYLTSEQNTEIDVVGARFSLDELERLLAATQGRALVLFTARGELDYAAEELQRRNTGHRILVQEAAANKQILVDEFRSDTNSVLLATKSFFTGVDFPGETCSAVVLAKYPLPQFNTLCKAQIAWWRGRGYPNWYEREGTLIARQAVGRLIRTEHDRGVIALLDQRKGMHDKIMAACTGSYVTRDVKDVARWLTPA
jgi:Rad3-related DNA helicase